MGPRAVSAGHLSRDRLLSDKELNIEGSENRNWGGSSGEPL